MSSTKISVGYTSTSGPRANSRHFTVAAIVDLRIHFLLIFHTDRTRPPYDLLWICDRTRPYAT